MKIIVTEKFCFGPTLLAVLFHTPGPAVYTILLFQQIKKIQYKQMTFSLNNF